MGDCGVCIGDGNLDGYAEFQDVSYPKARKEHKCCECRRVINKGEVYHKWSGKWDGDLLCQKTCAQCEEIRSAFSCSGSYEFERLWDDMEEIVFPSITTGCYERLDTPEARSFLQKKWIDWKGL